MSHLCLEINLSKIFKASTHANTHYDEDLNKQICHVHGQEDNIVKVSVFFKLTFIFNKIPIRFFIVFDRMNSPYTSEAEKQEWGITNI